MWLLLVLWLWVQLSWPQLMLLLLVRLLQMELLDADNLRIQRNTDKIGVFALFFCFL